MGTARRGNFTVKDLYAPKNGHNKYLKDSRGLRSSGDMRMSGWKLSEMLASVEIQTFPKIFQTTSRKVDIFPNSHHKARELHGYNKLIHFLTAIIRHGNSTAITS